MKTNLRDLRKSRNMTQSELAALISATVRQIGSWERDEAEMSLENACDIADVFGCSLDALVGRKRHSSCTFSDVRQNQINEDYESMNETGRARLAEQAEMMASSGMFAKSEDNKVSKSA